MFLSPSLLYPGTNCPPGRYSAARGLKNKLECSECPPGYGSSSKAGAVGPEDCGECKEGWFSAGGKDCTMCSKGQYSDEKHSRSCKFCPAGHYGDETGLDTAMCSGICPTGTTASTGQLECTTCAESTFAPPKDPVACLYCADEFGESFTSEKGSDTCVCKSGFFLTATNASCHKCPKGAGCEGLGSTLEELPIDFGFWRPSVQSSRVLPCPHPDACVGSNATNVTSFESGSVCAPGNAGVLCAVCDKGFARYGSQHACVKCSSNLIAWVWFIAAFVALAFGLVIVVLINRKTPNGILRPMIDFLQRLTV